MPKQVRFRRGTTAQHATFTGAEGEVTFDTDKKCLVAHDGVTPGGRALSGFLKLDTGVEESHQTLLNGLHIEGSDANGFSLVVGGPVSFQSEVIGADRISGLHFRNTVTALTYAASVALRFDLGAFRTLALTGDVTFTLGNKVSGVGMALLLSAGGSLRNLSWPSGMKWVGAAAPASLAANKVAVVQLWCFGATDADVVARYLAEP